MKFNNVFDRKLNCKCDDEVFDYLLSTLKESIITWDYFVNWNKVIQNYRDVEVSLNILNTLIGKDNIEIEIRELLKEYPKIMSVIPSLLAYREKRVKMLSDIRTFNYVEYKFDNTMNIDEAITFLKNSGFLELLSNKNIKSIPDYFIGVEVGLDTNGRKNRGGTSMENIIDFFIDDICKRNNYQYISQATADKIYSQWGKNITVKESSKRIDFAINNGNELFLIETNFYGSGGSKLKSTAGEYSEIYQQWKADGNNFIWITDGYGWKSTSKPLRDTFNSTDYILNIDMVQKGILEDLLR